MTRRDVILTMVKRFVGIDIATGRGDSGGRSEGRGGEGGENEGEKDVVADC